MNTNRNGKIARIPRLVREQLNRRLQDGETGQALAKWLNGLPEVQAILAAEFAGKAIREQNLSEWKQGGYQEWLAQQAALEVTRQLADDVSVLRQAGEEPLADILAQFLTAQYVVAVNAALRRSEDATLDLKLLRGVCGQVVSLRRGDHYAERLRLERQRLDLDRRTAQDHLENPGVQT